jgi:hypothetical protein
MVGGSLRYPFKIALKYFKNNLRRPYFVNPDNPDIHTQNIKNMWMRVYLLVIRTITNLYSTSTPTIFLRFASIVSGRNSSLRYPFKIALKYFKNNLRRPFENCEFTSIFYRITQFLLYQRQTNIQLLCNRFLLLL